MDKHDKLLVWTVAIIGILLIIITSGAMIYLIITGTEFCESNGWELDPYESNRCILEEDGKLIRKEFIKFDGERRFVEN